MKRTLLITYVVFQFFSLSIAKEPIPLELLSKINSVDSIQLLKETNYGSIVYMIWFKQLLDNNRPELGTFQQRVVYEHRSFDAPVVVVMEGYELFSTNLSEPAKLLNANQITIEHRFFNESRPKDSIPWTLLNITNAAADQHQIIQSFKPFYKGKWISTGISKGGQTAIFHRSFYPMDVDITIPYVAPVNFSDKDERVFTFLDTVGSGNLRKSIYDFQIELLKRKNTLMEKFIQLIDHKGWNFSFSIDSVYDYSVFEFSFAYWQWGRNQTIPDISSSDSILFQFFSQSGAIEFFVEDNIEKSRPFFYQALTEIGMYGYNTKQFESYSLLRGVLGFRFTLPSGYENVQFNTQTMQRVDNWVKNQGNYVLYIYGGQDPWSAMAAQPSVETNSRRFFNPGGNHSTRIASFPKDMQDSILSLLEEWLACKIDRKP